MLKIIEGFLKRDMKVGHAGRWELGNLFIFPFFSSRNSLDQIKKKKEKEERKRVANWLAIRLQTNDQLALPACWLPLPGCLATPIVPLGC